jgi:RNA polymerase sigma factor for flagellar operon FliA
MMAGPAIYSAVEHQDREKILLDHAPLVKQIAYHLINRLPATVQIDDLIQAGMMGLLESVAQYDARQGASFKTYAGIRIRGAMLDEVRRQDWTPRSVHRKSREMAGVIRTLENRLGRKPSDAEIISELGILPDEYHQILQDATTSRIFSYDQIDEEGHEYNDPSDNQEPLGMLEKAGFQTALAEAIRQLPEREQLIMSLYYDDELNLREIGEVLGVSESRISQIHGRIMIQLRKEMLDWSDESDEQE